MSRWNFSLGLKPQAEPKKPAESRFRLSMVHATHATPTGFSRFPMIEPGVSTQGGTAGGYKKIQSVVHLQPFAARE
jgi:hypothetical protein